MTRSRINVWQGLILVAAGFALAAVSCFRIASGDHGAPDPFRIPDPEPQSIIRAEEILRVRVLTADGVHFSTLWQFRRRDPDTGRSFLHPIAHTENEVTVERLTDGTYAAITKSTPTTVIFAPTLSDATFRDEVCR